MSTRYRVRVTKDHLTFCSGHFITYDGDNCERLHGHNYRTSVEIEGPLDENHYVFDFITLKDLTQTITDKLDHRMLLPTRNSLIRVNQQANSVQVQYEKLRWEFPLSDCVLLPIENTTSELLAQFVAHQLLAALKSEKNFTPAVLRVEVEESPGQAAQYEWQSERLPPA